jgi:DNA modification methylase
MIVSIANGLRISDGTTQLFISQAAPKSKRTRMIRLAPGDQLAVVSDNSTDAWEIGRVVTAERYHPTQKPVELFRIPIRNHTMPGDIVVDPFAGAGGQFVAANESGRRCYGMELEPKFCAVILERLARAGLEPKKNV